MRPKESTGEAEPELAPGSLRASRSRPSEVIVDPACCRQLGCWERTTHRLAFAIARRTAFVSRPMSRVSDNTLSQDFIPSQLCDAAQEPGLALPYQTDAEPSIGQGRVRTRYALTMSVYMWHDSIGVLSAHEQRTATHCAELCPRPSSLRRGGGR